MRNIVAEDEIRQRFEQLEHTFNERSRRLFAASEAEAYDETYGRGGIVAVHRATGLARRTIGVGLRELRGIEAGEEPGERIRRAGAGRPKTALNSELINALKELVESTTRGDPESPLLWTSRSQQHLTEALSKKGYTVSRKTIGSLLKTLGYSLQGNRKRLEGAQHPDRDAQFEHINEKIRSQLAADEPAISVDTKKRELVGNYKNAGVELRPKQDPEEVNVHDFKDEILGHVSPYGVYDLQHNEAWVSVGISSDTAEFSVQAVRTWWDEMGKQRHPDASSLLITADCGGSNGYRVRLWKVELQKLADELQFPICVCHLPPGTSKWNKIEHRLFSFITKNWRGKPLVTHEVIVNLIASTTTKTGLKVGSRIDANAYAKGKRVTERQLADVHLEPDAFHGEWNYAIHPSASQAIP